MKIITRAEWGARPFRTPPPFVPLSARREVTLHYPGAGTPPRDVREYAKWIERIHMDQNGWRGVGYNYFVSNGQVAEGCGRDVRGAHSPPHNVDGIGINIWTSNGVPTEVDKRVARELYDQLCRESGRTLRIGWHGRDFATACPGPLLIAWAKAGMPTSGQTPGAGAPTGKPADTRTDLERLLDSMDAKTLGDLIYAKTAAAIDDSGNDIQAGAYEALRQSVGGKDATGYFQGSTANAAAWSAHHGQVLRAQVAGLQSAIEALAASQGADPAAIREAVREAVREGVADALAELEAEVKLTIGKDA